MAVRGPIFCSTEIESLKHLSLGHFKTILLSVLKINDLLEKYLDN